MCTQMRNYTNETNIKTRSDMSARNIDDRQTVNTTHACVRTC